MNKKRLVALVVAVVRALCLLFALLHLLKREDAGHQEFAFARTSNIKWKDIEACFQVVDLREKNPRAFFRGGAVNASALQFLMFLESHFREFDNEKYLFDHVNPYLHKNLFAETAGQLFELHNKTEALRRRLAIERGLSAL